MGSIILLILDDSNPIRVYKSDRITQIDGALRAAINLSSDPNVGFNRWGPLKSPFGMEDFTLLQRYQRGRE